MSIACRKLAWPFLMATAGSCLTAAPVSAAEQLIDSGSGNTGPAAASDDQPQTGEIIVTANKRSESVQKSPVAITAISGAVLAKQGITNALDLRKVVSGAVFARENNVVQSFIRGVGGNLDLPYVDSKVGININDINLPRAATGSGFFDLQRVEVLPGPQGTLYGGAATGGVVNLVSVAPAHNLEGSGSIEFGNYDSIRAELAQNLPVTDTLALRGAFAFSHHKGYQSRGLGSVAAEYLGRVSALWTPTADFTAHIFGSVFNSHGKPDTNVNIPLLNPKNPWEVPAFGPVSGTPVDADYADFHFQVYVLGGRFDYNLGGVKITYIPGVSFTRIRYDSYSANFPNAASDKETKFSNEIRLSNIGSSKHSWQIGLYQAHNKVDYSFFFRSNPVVVAPNQVNKNYAIYAQDIYKVADSVRFTAGGRFSYDSKSVSNGRAQAGVFSAHHHWQHFDWKIGVDADLARDVLGYASVQTGYLPGGYFPAPNTATFSNKVASERLLSYTAGFKSRWLGGALTVNSEAFYYIYKDFQIVAINLAGGQINTFGNAPRAIIYGNQLNVTIKPTSNDTLQGGLTAMRTKFTDFQIGATSFVGFDLANAPRLSGDIGYEHKFDLTNGGDISFQVHSHIQSGYWGLYSHARGTRREGYTKTDLTLAYNSPGERWSLGAWVRNVENTPVYGAAAVGGQPGPATAYIEAPRTYGVRLSANW